MRSAFLLAVCTLVGAIVCVLICAPYITGPNSDQKTIAVTAILVNVGALGGFALYESHRSFTKHRQK